MYNFYANQPGLLYKRKRTRKILLIMKITTLLMITAILHVSATTLAQKVTLNEKNAPLIDVFNDITAQTNYDFAFTTDAVKNANTVTINVKNEELKDVLAKILQGQKLSFSIENKTVTIQAIDALPLIEPKVTTTRPAVTVSGIVQNQLGEPMSGVTVRQKNVDMTRITDKDGVFITTVADNNSVLIFSYVGYESQELRAKDISTNAIIIMNRPRTTFAR